MIKKEDITKWAKVYPIEDDTFTAQDAIHDPHPSRAGLVDQSVQKWMHSYLVKIKE